ncbi:MAG: restriction endonuclease subunit S [Butyrivibrio sp.]|nr:restriction endonuclease subunit S [Butyrivibrio sp.]
MEIKTVEECFYHIQNGANIKQGVVEGGYPVTRIETISNDKFNRDKMGYAGIENIDKYISYVLEDGDLLMSHINSIQYLGRTVLYEKQENEIIIHGMNLLRLKADCSLINQRYARYYFCSHTFREQVMRITKKSVNQASFAVSDLKRIKIRLPKLIEQEKIAIILDKTNKLISLYKMQIQKLDELIKSKFVEMFGDMANPMCLHFRCTLAECCQSENDIKCGPFGTQLNKGEYQEEGVAVWEIPQINSGFSEKPAHYITVEKANELSAYSLIPGDIAMSRKGNVGRCGLYPEDFEPGIIHSDVLRIRVDREIVNPCFMMYQLHFSRDIQHQIETVSSGAIMAGVNVTKLKNIYVYVPNYTEQLVFEDFVKQTDKLKATVQKALDETQLLFDSLMQEYFE